MCPCDHGHLWNWPLSGTFVFHIYLPMEKDVTLHLNQLESLSAKESLCKFGWILLCESKEDEIVKS